MAFGTVAVPFALVLIKLLLASGAHVYLSSDLAIIDIDNRRAMQFQQQLGVYDRFGWDHPGPTYFYLTSIAYWLVGSGARAMFLASTSINALSALACVEVVRRRSGGLHALWTAICLCLLCAFMAAGVAGGAVVPLQELTSPWNPIVVTIPLLMFFLLSAASISGSRLSLLGAALTGSFIIQTNISTAPLVIGILLLAGVWTFVLARAPSQTIVGSSRWRSRLSSE